MSKYQVIFTAKSELMVELEADDLEDLEDQIKQYPVEYHYFNIEDKSLDYFYYKKLENNEKI